MSYKTPSYISAKERQGVGNAVHWLFPKPAAEELLSTAFTATEPKWKILPIIKYKINPPNLITQIHNLRLHQPACKSPKASPWNP